MRVYVASPLGFSEIGRTVYFGTLLPKIRSLGIEVADPWSLTSAEEIARANAQPAGHEQEMAWSQLNAQIGRRNREAIDSADCVFAVLDGSDVDSGTAAEIGYAFAKGKRVIGYRGDFRLASDNVGCAVNLQIEYFILASGGIIESTMDHAIQALMRAS